MFWRRTDLCFIFNVSYIEFVLGRGVREFSSFMFWKSASVYLKSEGEGIEVFQCVHVYFENWCLWYCIRVAEKCWWGHVCITLHYSSGAVDLMLSSSEVFLHLHLKSIVWLDITRMLEWGSDRYRGLRWEGSSLSIILHIQSWVDLKQDPRQTEVDVSSLRAGVPRLVCKQPITHHYRGQWGFDLFRRRLEVKSRHVTFIYVAFFTMHTVPKRLKSPDHQISCTGKASACAQVQ